MFDTTVTIVGNAITMPEWRRLDRSGSVVAHFKVASHPRRFDRTTERWVDGVGVRVRVTCWRRLADGVAGSVKVGDPVIVTGRLFCRDWTTDDGQHRVSYEVEAISVGHDLSRGLATFERNRSTTSTTVVEDVQTDNHIAGEPSEVVADSGGSPIRLVPEPAGLYASDLGEVPAVEPIDDDLAGADRTDGMDEADDDPMASAMADLDDVLSEVVVPAAGSPSGTGTARRRRGQVPAGI